jgi:hypothetical protein
MDSDRFSAHRQPLTGAMTHAAGVAAVLHRAQRIIATERRTSLASVLDACARAGSDLGLPVDVITRARALVTAATRVHRRRTRFRLFPRLSSDARTVLADAIVNAEGAMAAHDGLWRVSSHRARRDHKGVIVDRRV